MRSTNHDTVLRGLRLVSSLACTLVVGLTLSHVLQAPGRTLDGATWLRVQHRFYGGFAIVGGLGELVGLGSTATDAALRVRQLRSSLPPTLAALCLLGTMLDYWSGNRLVNSQVAQWTSATLPTNWASYRDTWEAAHAVSGVVSFVALAVLVVATIWLPVSDAHGADPPSRRRWCHARFALERLRAAQVSPRTKFGGAAMNCGLWSGHNVERPFLRSAR